MDVLFKRCAGLDVSKRDAKACVRIADGPKIMQTITTWTSMTNQVHELARHLLSERVGRLVLKATSDYWRQFYFILEEAGLNVQLVNARDARNLPGHKTMSRTRRGWPNSALTGWSAAVLFRRPIFAGSAT